MDTTIIDVSKFIVQLNDRKSKIKLNHANLRDLKPLGDERFKIGDEEVSFIPSALKELTGMIGIPSPFYRRCDNELQAHLVEKFLGYSENHKIHPVIYNDGSELQVYGFWDDNKPFVHLHDMFEIVNDKVVEVTNGNHEVSLRSGSSEYSSDSFFDERGGIFSWTSESYAKEAGVGDIVESGVRLAASDWMAFDPSVTYYINRLICSNGMVSSDDIRFEVMESTGESLLSNIQRSTQSVMDSVGKILLDPFIDTNNHAVDDPIGMARSIVKDRDMKKNLADRFIENVENMVYSSNEGSTYTIYDVINMLTQVQNEENIKWNDRVLLQFLGGVEVAEHYKRCTRCHHVLN